MPLLSLWDTEGDVDRDEEATELIATAELDLAASESTHCRRRELLNSGADGIGHARLLSPTNRARGTRRSPMVQGLGGQRRLLPNRGLLSAPLATRLEDLAGRWL
jgi:hypothetical protein